MCPGRGARSQHSGQDDDGLVLDDSQWFVVGEELRLEHAETVELLLEDVAAGNLLAPDDPSPAAIERLLDERRPHHVSSP